MLTRSCSTENSGVCTPATTSPCGPYFAAQARTYGSVRSQLTHVNVQKSTRTTLPRSPAAVSGAELIQALAPSKDASAPSTGRRLADSVIVVTSLEDGESRGALIPA